MKKKITCLLVLAFFTNTTKAIYWSDWSPVSLWKTRKLSSDKKAIRSIIKNCADTSLDTKFNLEQFLEEEQPRTVYEWVKVLKINYPLSLALQALAKVNADTTTQYFEIPNPHARKTTGNRIATINYWNNQIQGYRNQRSALEPRLSFLPNSNFSLADHNFINPTCADQILANLEKTFPYLTTTTPATSPLSADQFSIFLQLISSLPTQQQNKIKTILQQNPINLVFLFFQLWAITSDPTQKSTKASLLKKIAETAWQNSPDAKTIHPLKDAENNAITNLKNCTKAVEGRDRVDCANEENTLRTAQDNLQSALEKNAPLEESFKQKFHQDFTINPARLLSIPSSLAQIATRYLQSYYPELS